MFIQAFQIAFIQSIALFHIYIYLYWDKVNVIATSRFDTIFKK